MNAAIPWPAWPILRPVTKLMADQGTSPRDMNYQQVVRRDLTEGVGIVEASETTKNASGGRTNFVRYTLDDRPECRIGWFWPQL